MNKKLSLMLAAFVAAGYSLTAEAGVVKIANPEDGRSYVIATDDASPIHLYSNNQGGVSAWQGPYTANFGTLWEYNEETNGFSLYSAAGDAGQRGFVSGYLYTTNNSAIILSKDASVLTYDEENAHISLAGVSNALLNLSATSATFGATGSDLYFYAPTTAINSADDAEELTGRTVQIGNQYLVVNPQTSEPELVSATRYNEIKAVLPENTIWNIDTDGILTTANESITSNTKVEIDAQGNFSFGSTGTALETNAEEGLAGYSLNGKFYQFLNNGNVKDITNGFTATDKKKFVSISHSADQYIPGAPELANYDFISGNSVTSASGFLIGFNDGTDNQFICWDTTSDATDLDEVDADSEAQKMDEKFIWTPVKNADGSYSFVANVGGKDKILKIGTDGATDFYIDGVPTGFRLYVLDGTDKKYVEYSSGALSISGTANSTTSAVVFGAYQAASIAYTAEQLIEYQGTSFMLDLTDAVDGKDMNQNPFAEKALVPMIPVDANGRTANEAGFLGSYAYFTEAEGTETSYLLNISGTDSYIVVDRDQKWTSDQLGAYIADGGYKFITFEKDNLIKYLNNAGKQSERDLMYLFSINHVPNKDGIADITVTDLDGVDVYYLVSYNSNKNYYLTVNADKQNLVQAKFGSKYAITVASTENNPFNDRYVTITFSNHKSIKAQSLYGSSVPLNGKVLGMSENGAYAAPQSAEKVRLDAPEGQWIVLATTTAAADDDVAANGKVDNNAGVKGTDTRFTFVNRESGVSFTVNRMYWIEGDKYAVESNNPFAHAQRDTMIIANANVTKDAYNNSIMEDGAYANYKAADILDQEYNLIVKSTQSDYYVSENHAGQHLLGITEAAEDAVNWQIIPMTAARILDKDGYLEMPTDTVYNIKHTQYWSNGALYQTTDTLAMISYVLKNTANGEYITYENPQTHDVLSMICDPKSENLLLNPQNADEYFAEIAKGRKYATNDYRFIIKLKPEGKTNLIGVESTGRESLEYRTIALDKKLYGATTQKNGAIEVENAYNRVNSNDLFEVAKIDAPEYKLVDRGDTVRIFRAEDEYSVMYENGQFLNLGNIATVEDMAPALYVDTAFVNRTDEYGKNNRYQYLLVVNPKYVPAEPCDIPGHPELHPDTTYGRFLINMIDSAVWANANGAIHNNKFINDTEADETYVKVGFHWGYRTGDALYLTEDNTYSKVEKKIALDSRDFNIAKFAFRYTNAASNDPNGSFKIQTRYIDYNDAIKGEGEIYESNDGFLRTVNGVVVITEGYARGEEFNLAAETSDPTANETITAEGAVSVVATDGAVTIKGAEGKNVVIATILGKVVANETINSDNETIAVPAGIAVVSVDGESFKVVVK